MRALIVLALALVAPVAFAQDPTVRPREIYQIDRYSEPIPLRALEWLRLHQTADGSWGDRRHTCLTSLALLAYLGHGETNESERYRNVVNKAVDWLLAHEVDPSAVPLEERSPAVVRDAATRAYVLAEYLGMTKDDRVKPSVERAVRSILAAQSAAGDWPDATLFDRMKQPAFFWRVLALQSAALSGIEAERTHSALVKVREALRQNRRLGAWYEVDGQLAKDASSAIGAMAEAAAGPDEGFPRVLTDQLPIPGAGEAAKWPTPGTDLLYTYAETRACLFHGGSVWQRWNRFLQEDILTTQQVDGRWPALPPSAWESLQSDPGPSGETYRVALGGALANIYHR